MRFGDLAYLTDVKTISPDQLAKLAGIRFLVLNALRRHPHGTHLSLSEALEMIEKIAPEHAWITHISHEMGLAAEVQPFLPPNVSLAYDGLEIEF
jgi:phosphoribosyl 1,2-cyclic phosphate phosphodiesterase